MGEDGLLSQENLIVPRRQGLEEEKKKNSSRRRVGEHNRKNSHVKAERNY